MRVESRWHSPSIVFTAVGRLEAEYSDYIAALDVVGHSCFSELVGHMHCSWERLVD